MTQSIASTTAPTQSKWKPYPAYKDSGVEWFQQIPKHWQIKRLKYACEINPTKSEISHLPRETEVSFLPMEQIGEDGSVRLDGAKTIEQVWQGYTYFRNQDVILAKITPCFENGKGAICTDLVNGIGFGTTELHVLRARNGNRARFIFYLTQSYPFRGPGVAMMYGAAGQQRVPEEFIKDYYLGLPSPEEQEAIINFLDRETAKIDGLIAKKERLIELLEEKRTALISHAVTKGLNPNAPMKDSDIEWLGEIPAHWQVKRLKFLAEEPLSYGANEAAESTDPNCPRFIRITDIDAEGRLIDDTFRSLPEEVARPFLLRRGDVLFARSGATVGKTFLYSESWGRACHAGYLIRMRTDERKAASEFIAYFATSINYWSWISGIFIQATIQNVSAERYANLKIGVPPLEEQKTIAGYLNAKTSKINTLISKIRQHIEKLREYRTALISAAVTGKIDVRKEVRV